jgi:hypothetical protein
LTGRYLVDRPVIVGAAVIGDAVKIAVGIKNYLP